MKEVLAFIGAAVLLLTLLGAAGVGDFVFYYGPSIQQWCQQKGNNQ